MFPTLFSLRALAIGGLVSLVVGFGAGWMVQGWRLDNEATAILLKQEQAKTAALQHNLTTIAAVLGLDAKKAAEDDLTLEDIDALAEKVSKTAEDKPALSATTVDGLRNLWDKQ